MKPLSLIVPNVRRDTEQLYDEDERRRTETIIKPILRGRDISGITRTGWAVDNNNPRRMDK